MADAIVDVVADATDSREGLIDGVAVNGSAKLVGWVSQMTRLFQTGHLYQYAFMMIIGVFILLTYWFNRG